MILQNINGLSDEEIHRLLAETTDHWEGWIAPDGSPVYLSPAVEGITGYTIADFQQNPKLYLNLVDTDDLQKIDEYWQQEEPDKLHPHGIEFRFHHRDGSEHWVQHKSRRIYGDNGDWLGWRISNRDTTTLKQVTRARDDSQGIIEAMFNSPDDLILIIDRQEKILFANRAFIERTPNPPHRMVGLYLWDIIDPQLVDQRKKVLAHVIETRHWQKVEDQNPRGIFETYIYPVLDTQGEVSQIVIIGHDITQYRKLEAELHQSQRQLQTLLEYTPAIIGVIDRNGVTQMVQGKLEILGYDPRTEISKSLFESFAPWPQLIDAFEQARNGQNSVCTAQILSGDFVEIRFAPMHDSQGNINSILALGFDVTERKLAEDELHQTRQQLQTTLDNAPIILGVIGNDGIIQLVQGNLNILGFDPRETIGQSVFETFMFWPEYTTAVQQALTGQNASCITHLLNQRFFDIRCTPVFDSQGNVDQVITIGTDITERKLAEDELVETRNRLAVILEGVADSVYVLDSQYGLTYVNSNAKKRSSFPAIAAILKNEPPPFRLDVINEQGELIPPEQMPSRLAIEKQQPQSFNLRYIVGDEAEENWVAIKSTPVFDYAGKVQYTVTITQDITELKRTQIALQAARDELEQRVEERTAELARTNQALLKEIKDRLHAEQQALHNAEQSAALARIARRMNAELEQTNQELLKEIEERQRAEKQAIRNANQSAILAHIASRINAELDLPTIFDTVVTESLRAIPGMTNADLMLLNPETDYLEVVSSCPPVLPGDPPKLTIPLSILKQTINALTNQPTAFSDAQQTSFLNLYDGEHWQQVDLRSLIFAPLQYDEQLIGVLTLSSTGVIHEPQPDEVAFIYALADQATVAIKNARLFEGINQSNKQLHELNRKLIELQETEQRKLAKELHDEIGGQLTSLTMALGRIVQPIVPGDPDHQQALVQIDELWAIADDILQDVRNLSLRLRPEILDDLGLLPALIDLTGRISRYNGLQIDFKHSGLAQRFPPEIETAAFRVVQGSLTNIVRHAKVSHASVRIRADQRYLSLRIEDKGVGFDPQQQYYSTGLSGMRERVQLCGGQLEIETEPGKGVCLTADLPLKINS